MTKGTYLEVKERASATRKRSRSDDTEETAAPAMLQPMRTSRSMTALSPTVLYDPLPDVVPTPPLRRRVNPASLANRLGPELVAELEALIKPGCTEMPSFAARQAIQKKYMVDRRHIYDWYHTKGLRVSSKSEKRNAMVHAELEESRSLRPRFQKKLRSVSDTPRMEVGSNYSISTSSTPLSTPITQHTPSALPSALPSGNMNMDYTSHLSSFPIHHFFDSPTAQPQAVPCTGIQIPVGKPIVTEALDPSGRYTSDSSASPKRDRTSHWVTENQHMHNRSYSNPIDVFPFLPHEYYFNENMNPFLPTAVTQDQSLPKSQREACYRYISDALGPAQGLQESVGTYRAYMTQQVQTYYERILPDPYPAPPVHSRQPVVSVPVPPATVPVSASVPSSTLQASTSNPRPVAYHPVRRNSTESAQSSQESSTTPEIEYSNWMFQNQLHALTSLPGTLPSSESSFSWPWNSQSFNVDDSSGSSLEISDILESPILRTRHNTRNASASPPAALVFDSAQLSKPKEELPSGPTPKLNSLIMDCGSPVTSVEIEPLAEPIDLTIRQPASFSMSLLSRSDEKVTSINN